MRQYEAVREAEEEEEQEVAKLQAELDKLKSYNGLLVKRENDYRRIGQDIKEKALQGSLNPELPDENGREKMEELEREKEELVRLIANDDALLEEESIIPPKLSSSKELYNEICAEIEDLIKSPAEDGSRLSIQGLTDKLGSVMAGMNERLDRLVAIDVNEKEMSVYNQLLTFFHNRALNPDDREIDVDSEKLSEAFPHITNTTVPQLMLSDTSLRITAVLLKLYNEGPMTLQNLVTYVDDFSRNHVVSSETTQTIIYSLVAADLVVIDRRHKDSLVKLKL
ncbi:uncharacterized protein EV154DRAFT_181995 [Mucor mucedo]|uniref:uncharacterized protein n=1 Tax=Mucor mucedo TaxID=29922 RepID=UPI00221E668D|nr:uncharacterized protein EV154DRAFT_181995 [Mucor mucedo]KAI7892712.1 hypothetical protein EV154DRAFT_181995 [Mucor mucedo]